MNIDKPWRRIRERANFDDVKIHDLRRTVGSWSASDGESMRMVAGMLGHSTTRITVARYAHLTDDPRRDAFQRHAERVVEAAGVDPVASALKGVE